MKKNTVHTGKRKASIARAFVKPGKGMVYINNKPLELVYPKLARMRIQEALLFAGDILKNVDVYCNVKGGGYMGQANAARVAIGKALVDYSGSNALKNAYLEYDRSLLISDVRRKETRKPNTHGNARAKVQKSYR